MKFTVDRDVLANSYHGSYILYKLKSTSPIRMGVLLAEKETLTLQAVGDDSSSKCVIEAEVETEGAILVSGKIIS